MRIRSIFPFVLLLLVAACADKGAGPVISSGDRYAAGAPSTSSYQLAVGDRVKIIVFGEQTLSGDFGVAADGSISLPLIGNVQASGKTVDQVVAEAQSRYADGYLRDPKLSGEVSVLRSFFVLGEVAQAGSYPYAVGLTALNAVATAKGFTPRANRKVVFIRRQGETGETKYELTPQLLVYPGDTLRIAERYF